MTFISTLRELRGGQVALLRTDPDTGVPVNEAGEWLRTGEEKYLVFAEEEQARKYAMSLLCENALMEWSLIDSTGNQIAVLHDREALLRAKQR